MLFAIIVLICVSIMVLGAAIGKPMGWVAIFFAVLAFLIALFGLIGAGPSPFK